MKQLFLLVPLLLTSLAVVSQELEINDNYYFISDGGPPNPDEGLRLNVSDPPPEEAQIKVGHEVSITYVTDERVFFKYLRFKVDSLRSIYNEQAVEPGKSKIFSLPRTEFVILTKPLYDRFRGIAYGVYSVPVRLRDRDTPGNSHFEFDANASLGASIIPRFGRRKNEYPFVDFPFSAAITSVSLDPDNSDLGLPGSDFADVEALSPAAFTFSFGVVGHFNETVNLGIYGGFDWLSSADRSAKWVYNGIGWLGIGINASFSSSNDQDSATKQ